MSALIANDDLAGTSWLGACEAAYPKIYRALIAMGATAEDAADALRDAFERALSVREPGGSARRLALRRRPAAMAARSLASPPFPASRCDPRTRICREPG